MTTYLPNDVEEAIENDESSNLILPLETAALLAIPETNFSLGNGTISSGIVTGIETSVWEDSLIGVTSSGKVAIENSSFKISSNQTSFYNFTVPEVRSTEVSASQGSKPEISPFQISIPENSFVQERVPKFHSSQSSSLKIDFLKSNPTQANVTQINPTKISLSSSIALQQFLSSHNFSLQNTTVPTWLEFLQGATPFNIEIADLPTGQLAEANITGLTLQVAPTPAPYTSTPTASAGTSTPPPGTAPNTAKP